MDNIYEPPCFFCGYKSTGYFKEGTHAKDCPWHYIGGYQNRIDSLPHIIKGYTSRVRELEEESKQWEKHSIVGLAKERDVLRDENRRLREVLGGILNHYPLACVCGLKMVECFPCKAKAILAQAAKKKKE